MKRILFFVLPFSLLFSSCSSATSLHTPTQTLPSIPAATLSPTATPNSLPMDVPQNTILFYQDFESGPINNVYHDGKANWKVIDDNNSNHIYCNDDFNDYTHLVFGNSTWTNYAVEIKIKGQEQFNYAVLLARFNTDSQIGYYGTLDFHSHLSGLKLGDPFHAAGWKSFGGDTNSWQTWRLEAAGNSIKYYINNILIASLTDSQLSAGKAGLYLFPHLKVCIDNIRVWALDRDGKLVQANTAFTSSLVRQTKIEVITDGAATGNGGNAWGGHQTRIVRTKDGVFTAYTVPGDGQFSRDWRLVERQANGTWTVIAKGKAGQQPVNLLASPDGTLHIVGWPSGVGTMWSGRPDKGTISLTTERIPDPYSGNYPYSAAGTDANGDLCVLSTTGGSGSGGTLDWACYIPQQNRWIAQTNNLDYRYTYTYVIPGPQGQLSLVATRDVLWPALGYTQPQGEFEYVFNAFRYWRINDITTESIQQLSFAEEVPTKEYPDVYLDAQMDAYLDTRDRMHVLYWQRGATTQGNQQARHRIVSPTGDILYDGEIPPEAGDFSRIFQDKEESFYLLGSSGLIYPMDKDGVTLGQPITLDLGGYAVEYSGFGLSVPRTGTPLSNTMDVVFPSSNGAAWIYFQLNFK